MKDTKKGRTQQSCQTQGRGHPKWTPLCKPKSFHLLVHSLHFCWTILQMIVGTASILLYIQDGWFAHQCLHRILVHLLVHFLHFCIFCVHLHAYTRPFPDDYESLHGINLILLNIKAQMTPGTSIYCLSYISHTLFLFGQP